MGGLSHCQGSFKQKAPEVGIKDIQPKMYWPRGLRMSYIMRSRNEGTRIYLHEEHDQPEDWVLDWLPPGPAAHWLCKWSSVGRAASLLSLSWLGLKTQHILFGLELDFSIWQMREHIVMGYLCCLWLCNELETKSQKSNRHFTVIISTLLYPITIWHIKLYELFVILLPHTKCIHLGRKDVILVTILLPIFQSRQVLVKFTRTTW